MLSKILNIGIHDSLDLEDRARVKMQNSISLFAVLLIYFFTLYHIFYTHKVDVAIAFLSLSFFVPLIFWFQSKRRYVAARIILFLFLYVIVFIASMVLLVGHGNEYYYITISILILVLSKKIRWTIIFITINIFLFLLPHYYFPDTQETYIVSTHIAVFISALLAVLFFKNIQKQFRLKLREQKVHLEILNEEKDDLMSVVAHDLKSPLSQIQGLISILNLNNEPLNKEQQQLIDSIDEIATNQHNQISTFLNVKALEESIENEDFVHVPVNKIIKMVVDEMLPLAFTKNIQIETKNTSKELAITGSQKGLFKIISNLISNSIKYSHANTTITLEAKPENVHVLIVVKDQGQGFKKNEQHRVFEKNVVLSAKPTADESSSGMGLYIVKKYVDRMKGEVWFESEQGEGTTFYIKLPKQQ